MVVGVAATSIKAERRGGGGAAVYVPSRRVRAPACFLAAGDAVTR